METSETLWSALICIVFKEPYYLYAMIVIVRKRTKIYVYFGTDILFTYCLHKINPRLTSLCVLQPTVYFVELSVFNKLGSGLLEPK